MLFEFNPQEQFMSSLIIEDIGNVAIRGANNEGEVYFIGTQTAYGKTVIVKFGPVLDDVALLLDSFFLSYTKIDYKEQKINKEISGLLNDPKKGITEAEIVSQQEMWQALPKVAQFNISEETESLEEI